MEKQKNAPQAPKEPSEEEVKALKARAKEYMPKCVERYAAIMGVKPSGVKITGAKKRFGSCSGKNSICFSWRLMMYPQEAIDYVAVHELAHILHKNHGREFYACVEKIMPDYKMRQKLLRG